jgi:hypothetical protein
MNSFGIPIEKDTDGSKTPAQSYLITYPLFDMSMDFSEYINGIDDATSRVPPIEISQKIADAMALAYSFYGTGGNNLPYERWIPLTTPTGDPLQVDLGDLKSLVSDITFSHVGFVMKLNNATSAAATALQKAIRIRIPELKIGAIGDTEESWEEGELKDENGKYTLVFENNPDDPAFSEHTPLLLLSDGDPVQKAASEKITIEIKLANKIDAGKYTSAIDFAWYSIKAKPQAEAGFTGEFEGFDLGSYLQALGNDVNFTHVPAYLYLEMDDDWGELAIDLKVRLAGSGTVNPLATKNDDLDFYRITTDEEENIVLDAEETIDADFPWLKIEDPAIYDFTEVFAGAVEGAKNKIVYEVRQNNPQTVINTADAKDKRISATLAILLPMIFTIEVPAADIITISDTDNNDGRYLPVNFKGMDDFLGTDGNDSVMGQIAKQLGETGVESLALEFRKIENDVTSPLYMAVQKNPDVQEWDIIPDKHTEKLQKIEWDTQDLSTLPKIQFLVKEDTLNSNEGRLYIKVTEEGETAFNINISVVAGIDLDKEIAF